ncbi:MAG TPA: hypothetical protein VFL99_09800 [Segeticoccus sp.]|uniref:hypothetical protein n=1 Tax=Segeticoccus sp. TaxID=2706531 RepID=UPI002D80760C|nr:hypothetical protein [Segeticoccus sp.]HET8600607.1 hypothetical protein [Segeticoccus sp.]
MRWLSANALHVGRRALFTLLLTTLALQLAAGVGLSWVAGFEAVRTALTHVTWPWLLVLVAGLVVSFVGYDNAYRGTFAGTPRWSLPSKEMALVAVAGFGGFLAHGATDLDVAALRAGGADRHDANVHVSALSGLEYGVLAIGGCGAAIAVLLLGLHRPPPDFTLPWAIIPVPGFLLAFWLATRYGGRLAGRGGWRGRVGVFLESIVLVRGLFARPFRRNPAVLGMALFWAGDALAAWAGLATFGLHLNVAQFLVGFATGMVFTRRTGPLAGAGILAVVLPVTLWYSGAALAVAVPGIFVYHVLSLWLPMPAVLRSLPTLRRLVDDVDRPGSSPTIHSET